MGGLFANAGSSEGQEAFSSSKLVYFILFEKCKLSYSLPEAEN
jgi:hypothetical protein